jgi:capsular exopolysaccharide synthesis family protein
MNLIARRNQLNETNKSYSSTLTSIPEKERKLLEISREQSIINNVYNFLLQKREETALSNASTVPDSRVLDVAESSIKPIGPKKIIAFPVALVFAFILTFMVVTFKDYLSSKIIFRYEIENLTNIPIVGEVSYIKNNKNIIPENSKLDVVTFQIHQIIASTGLYLKNNSRKKILIKSSVEGEGKSFISANLASTLASSGKKVVLVDFDLNNSTISDFFGIHKGPGISEYISGEKEAFDVIHTSSNPNLFILGSGKNAANTSIHHDDRLENLFKFLEQSFDVIVIDSAPIDPVSDALLLTQYTDLALHVVRHRLTPIIAIQKLNNENTQPNIGIIFNGVKSRGFFKGYDYGNGFEINNKKKSFSPNKITKAVNTELEKQA